MKKYLFLFLVLTIYFMIFFIRRSSDNFSVANEPMLTNGLIPITRNYDNTFWEVANREEKWYDYENSKWANAILVREDSREKYVVGKKVLEEDVLAYYVWIPRFNYQIFKEKNSQIGDNSISVINVKFVDIETKNKCNKNDDCKIGEWLTHPAFTFDNKEISGFWIGKFELTSDEAGCDSSKECIEKMPTIKPGIKSLSYLNISQFFEKVLLFKENSKYGLTDKNKIDSHMIKNIEWGAVAYLSASIYGHGSNEIWINPNSNALTGHVGDESSSLSKNETYSYDSSINQGKASTTGNIYGVYDMSGGLFDYTMSVMEDDTKNGIPMSGTDIYYNSGFSGKVNISKNDIGNYIYYDGNLFPDIKYYDLYEYSLSIDDGGRGKYGDATFEVKFFNDDSAYFANARFPWIIRGGHFSFNTKAGIWNFSDCNGISFSDGSTRAILMIF